MSGTPPHSFSNVLSFTAYGHNLIFYYMHIYIPAGYYTNMGTINIINNPRYGSQVVLVCY